jgi:hypothetical protein
MRLLEDGPFGSAVVATLPCAGVNGELWVLDSGRIADVNRSRCLTLRGTSGDVEIKNCDPRQGNPDQRWGFQSISGSTTIVNPGTGLALQSDPFLSSVHAVKSNGSSSQVWLVRSAGEIEVG